MQSSNARAAGWTAMILAALLISPPDRAHAGEGVQIIASLIKAIQSPGRIDYAERINAPRREGVTPENNFFAAIFPLLRVSSLDESHGEWVQALCDEIGCVHPAEESVKYVAPNDADYPTEVTESDIRESIQQAMLCPCSADENVIVHCWIRANHECWERVVEAADRSHSYRPLIPPAGRPLDWSLLPDVETCHGLTTLGLVRVQNDVHAGNLESARRTLITMQKLFRHLGTSATFAQKQMSHTCESLVVLAQSSYLAHPKLTSVDRWNYLTEVEQLPPVISAADCLDQIDRWAAFDSLQFNRSGILDPTEETEFSDDPEILKRQRLVRLLLALAANPSDMENGLNSLHDSAVEIFRQPQSDARSAAIREFGEELRVHASVIMSSSRLDGGPDRSRSDTFVSFVKMGRRLRGEALGKMFASMAFRNVDRLDLLEREHLTAQAMLGSLIAVLDEYERTGEWPNDAAGLRGPDGREVGIDPANGLPFRIRVVDDRLSIYTVGIDRIDHDGRSGKLEDGTIGDDFSVPIYSWTMKPKPVRLASEPVPERVSDFEIPREWKGVGIILASLSFGAISLWLRRRKA